MEMFDMYWILFDLGGSNSQYISSQNTYLEYETLKMNEIICRSKSKTSFINFFNTTSEDD